MSRLAVLAGRTFSDLARSAVTITLMLAIGFRYQTSPGGLLAGVAVAANALRGLILGPTALPACHTVAGQVATSLAWAAAITTTFAPIAVHTYRRTTT
jgi:hypothetical protein